MTGLGVAIQPTGVRTFFLARMVHGKRRYARICDADDMTVPEAWREARGLLASFIEPAKTDNGPKTPGCPMAKFVEEFLERYARHWKPSTLESNRYLIRNHILPAFGHIIAFEWNRIREEAGLPGLRLHDLRHSWASVAAMNDVGMVTVAMLPGHALVETTERYVHLSDRSVVDAVDRESGRISAALAGSGAECEGGCEHANG